ncbi:hypothetical protein BDF20DRAFT_826022 [Mycotypha africana]|uniref:uncharacterized protein n=1 Tax=Mycotypha africana TaxID=64632 RepID=UPI0023000B2C|nr:uncharacterized protein BDF20DRAFT_826022 [Mycotypha africana]KAI8970382.1 hypothetical protein BDF20DRAFT_826022 [Mycotypha africana]
MTFEQLTSVRHDGIVDEGIVFRALWQREALERVLFPLTLHDDDGYDESSMTDDERTAALNEYFDVDDTDAQERRRRLLLGTPRFRFRSSIFINPPSEENGWECEEKEVTTDVDMHAFDDDNDSNSSLWKNFYSKSETILGTSYRVQIEAQVMPRHRLHINDDLNKDDDEEEDDVQYYADNKGKIHYWIYCLNRHEGILENDRIDPEDRVLVAVTEQCERENGEPGEMGPGYVGQVLVDADLKEGVTVDVTVALEIFGFQKV